MQASKRIEVPPRLTVLVTLAQLLERLERSATPVSAEQYRSVVQHLASELERVERDGTFQALLNVFPAMAVLYENQMYEHAGLCRASLDASLTSEMEARAVITRAAQRLPG